MASSNQHAQIEFSRQPRTLPTLNWRLASSAYRVPPTFGITCAMSFSAVSLDGRSIPYLRMHTAPSSTSHSDWHFSSFCNFIVSPQPYIFHSHSTPKFHWVSFLSPYGRFCSHPSAILIKVHQGTSNLINLHFFKVWWTVRLQISVRPFDLWS